MITGKYKWREKERRGGEGREIQKDQGEGRGEGRKGGREEREGSDMDHWLS